MAAVRVPLPGRRALLRGQAVAAAPRPPWALPEAEFVAACSRCDACIDACPQAILLRGDGGFPELRFERGECTFCAACLDACPSPALDALRGRPWRWQATVDAGCLARQGVVCRSCADACPNEAVAFRLPSVDGPRIDPDRCSGCAACVAVCPSAAVRMVEVEATAA
jgi:ferredoxin-type protein NapF